MALNSLSNFSRELPKEPSCENISKSVHRFSRSLFIALAAICSIELNHLSSFGRWLAKEHFYEFFLKSVHQFSKKSCLKLFFSIYRPGGHFVHQSGTVLAILMDSHLRNIPV